MSRRRHNLTRRELIKLSAAAGGGAALLGSGSLFALSPNRWGEPTRFGLTADGVADTILVNGKVATMDATGSLTQAVAVRDGLILATGADATIRALAGPETLLVDLAGRTLTPGLIDPHCHFAVKSMFGGYYLPFIPPDVTSIVEMCDAIRDMVAGMAADEWVRGYYLTLNEDRYPDRHDLDPVAPDNPVFIMHQGGHWGCVNTRALEIAGITADTPNPTGGIIERDAFGEATGVLFNHRAMDLVRHFWMPYSEEENEAGMLATQALFAACGVTSFQDNNIRSTDSLATYQRLASDGRAYLRQALFFTLEWPSDLDRALAIEAITNPFTRFAGFKFLIDGQAPTAYCHQPHNGTSWDMPTWDPDNFKDTVRTLHDTGLQICVHCGGDAAADLALDAFEEAMNANPRSDPRHRLEHAVITTPEATQRIHDLGVVVSTQPQFIRGGDTWAEIFTAEQMARVIMTREWLDAGIHVALGSDTPTTPWYEPQATLRFARTRDTMSGVVLGPDQVLTAEEALRAHTIEAAYAVHEEDVKGSIEVGKLADLVVWSADPLTSTPDEVYRTGIDLTMVGGEVVYLGPRPPRRRVGRD